MRRRVAPLLVCLVATGLAVFHPGPTPRAHACSCAGVGLDEALATADAAFVGTLIEIRRPEVMLSSMDESRFVFDVETVYVGEVYEQQSVVTASDGASCGLELEVGARAIVFGNRDEHGITPDVGEYGANLCNGTQGFDGVPASFGRGAPPLAGSSPVGADDGVVSTTVRHWWWAVSALIAIVLVGFALRRSGARHSRVDPEQATERAVQREPRDPDQ